jgi:hypothetical protein
MAIAKEYQALFDALEKGEIDDAEFRRLAVEIHLHLHASGVQDNEPPPEPPNRAKT